MTSDNASDDPGHVPLSQALGAMIANDTGSGTIRIGALVEGTQERGFHLVMILLSLPFVSPVPLPGLSTVVGIALTIMALRVAWRLPPRLPSFLGDREIPRERMESFVRKTASALRVVEKIVGPRFGAWMTWPAARFFNSMLLALMGILLALPLPPVLPFSNSLPCWGIILIALAVMERDGVLIWLGYIVALGTFIYMGFFTTAVFVGIDRLFEWLRSALGMKIGRSQAAIFVLAFAGAALLVFLLVREGIRGVGAAIAGTGWWLIPIVAFHAIPLLVDVESWRVLFPKKARPRFRDLFLSRWIGESVGDMLPAAQIGGDIVRARLAALDGVTVGMSAASVIVDITIGVFTQIVFALLGVATLVAITGHTHVIGPVALVTALAGLVFVAFFAVQRVGIFRILGFLVAKLVDVTQWQPIMKGGESIDRNVNMLYTRRGGIFAGAAWTMCSWITGAGEFWIALHAMGVPASFGVALVMESLGQTVRGALFMVPGALGFQEVSFLGVGALLGMQPEIALALSLVKRIREIVIGVPGLLAWQWIEGRRLLKKAAAE